MIPKQENILFIQQSLLTSEDYLSVLKKRREKSEQKAIENTETSNSSS